MFYIDSLNLNQKSNCYRNSSYSRHTKPARSSYLQTYGPVNLQLHSHYLIEMGLSHFLNRFPKTAEKVNLSIPKPNTSSFLHSPSKYSFEIVSLNPIKHQNVINGSTIQIPNSNCLLPTHVNYRTIHVGSVKTQHLIDNQDPKSPTILQESEKLCRILSNHRDASDIEYALNSVGVNLSPILVVEILKKLSNAGLLALTFFKWAEKQDNFKHTAESYNALIEALGKIKQFKMIWNLVSDMKHKGVLSKDTFALISRRYARARKVKEAVEAFERMEKFGLKPELADYNKLIDTLSKSKNVERAQQLFDKMKNRKFKPDIKSYTILLEGWGQEQNMLRLNEVYREMKEDGYQPDVVTYGILIHAYCKAKKNDEAIEMFHEMEGKKIKPTPHIYCTLINGLGNVQRLDEAIKFFELSKASGFTPETPTYNAVVGAYCWSMRMYDAYRVVDEMRKCGLGPNSRTYDIILHHLIKAKRTGEAYSIFQRISDDPGCDPVVSTYEIIVRMFCNVERIDMAMKVWDEMKAKGVLPGMQMFSTLINSLCHENKLDDACRYFQEMLDMGIRPSGQLFSTLKEALLDVGREETALVLSQKLDNLRKTQLVG